MLFDQATVATRHYTSTTGIALPLRLVGSLEGLEMDHRNTFIRAFFDDQDRLLGFERWVYGDIQLIHRYGYRENGQLEWAEVTIHGEETSRVEFDQDGKRLLIPTEQ